MINDNEKSVRQIIDDIGPWVSSKDVAEHFGVSEQILQERIDAHVLLGVKLGPYDELFYPVQQFDESGETIPGLKLLLDEFSGVDNLTVATMLQNFAFENSQETIWDLLRAGEFEVVIRWARSSVQNRH